MKYIMGFCFCYVYSYHVFFSRIHFHGSFIYYFQVRTFPADQFSLSKVTGSGRSNLNCMSTSGYTNTGNDTSTVASSPTTYPGQKNKKRRQQMNLKDPPSDENASRLNQSLDPNTIATASNSGNSAIRWHNSSNAYMVFYQALDDIQPEDGELMCLTEILIGFNFFSRMFRSLFPKLITTVFCAMAIRIRRAHNQMSHFLLRYS